RREGREGRDLLRGGARATGRADGGHPRADLAGLACLVEIVERQIVRGVANNKRCGEDIVVVGADASGSKLDANIERCRDSAVHVYAAVYLDDAIVPRLDYGDIRSGDLKAIELGIMNWKNRPPRSPTRLAVLLTVAVKTRSPARSPSPSSPWI